MDIFQTRFKGRRNDIGPNFTTGDYFAYEENVSCDDIDGANKVLFPEVVNITEYETGKDIDGGYEYKYLDSSNVLQTKQIVVTNGKVLVNALGTTSTIHSGLTVGKKCRFAVLNDKLFIVNGSNYPLIYWGSKNIAHEMGAPAIVINTGVLGSVTGTVDYQVTYITSGGEEVLGTKSNSLVASNSQIRAYLPIGYSGVTQRKLYRKSQSDGIYRLVDTIANNTTAYYDDGNADSSLGATIPTINNQCPKPYFIECSYNKLIGCIVDDFPTQIFVGGSSIEMFDAAVYSDVSNIGNDNTPCIGMGQQFSQVVVGTQKHWYLVNVSTTTTSVEQLSVNIGCKNGYSVVNVPANASFPGGIMFLSTNNDIRILNGLTGVIAATLNNIETENWSQQIKGTLDSEINPGINIDAVYFNYMYHLLVGDKISTFNTKTNSWYSIRLIDNENTVTTPKTLFIYGTELYLGKYSESKIERMYKSIDYNGVDYTAILRTASLPTFPNESSGGASVTSEIKYFEEIQVFFLPSLGYPLKYKITINDDPTNVLEGEFNCPGGVYDSTCFDDTFYDTTNQGEDYRVIRIQKFGKWMNLELKSEEGIVHFRGYRLKYSPVSEKE